MISSNLSTRNKTSWAVMKSSVYALIIRNLQQRFTMNASNKRIFDLLGIFLEPGVHVLVWTMIRVFRNQEIYNNLSLATFILLGTIPWLFTYNIFNSCSIIIAENRGLFFFRQIKPLDPVFALLITELGIMGLVFCSTLLVFSLLGIGWQIQDPLRWLTAVALYVLFIAGLGLFIAVSAFFIKYVKKIVKTFMRIMYLFSGIFFSAQMLPEQYKIYFALNPMFQFITISRECFSNSALEYNTFGDVFYLFKCATISMTLGLGMYTVFRNKLMIEIMEH